MVQKFYAIKSEQAINKGMIISTIFASIVAGGCYFLGGFGRLFQVDVAKEGFDAVIPTMLSGLPTILIAVVVVLVLAASMSTLSSLVLTSSSTLTLDLIKPMNPEMGEKKQVTVMRSLIAVFVAISAVIAILQYKLNLSSIAQLMGISWGALAGAFLAPFIYGLYWKRTTAAGCAASFVFGISVMLANMLFRPYFPVALQSPINCGAFVMLAGMVIVPIVSLLTPKPVKADVDEMFSCYETTVQGPAKRFLGE
jgi:SSS family solute:Na+ symporter